MLFNLTWFLALVHFACGDRQVPFNAAAFSTPFTEDFDELAAESLERWHTPGIAISVVDGDETYAKV